MAINNSKSKQSPFLLKLQQAYMYGTITKVIRESMVRELHVCNNICLTIFVPLVIAVS